MKNDVINNEVENVVEIPEVETKSVDKKVSKKNNSKKVDGQGKSGAVTGCERLNVRQTPDMTDSNNIIGVIDEGTLVDIIQTDGDFFKIRVNGIEGYCVKKFIN